MAQPTQIKFSLPENSFNVIDNSAASTTTTLAGPTNPSPIGFDTVAPATVPSGANAQGTNPFGDTGTVLIDASGNDTASVNFKDATFNGNPVSAKAFTYSTVTKVLTNPLSATVNFKNPA